MNCVIVPPYYPYVSLHVFAHNIAAWIPVATVTDHLKHVLPPPSLPPFFSFRAASSSGRSCCCAWTSAAPPLTASRGTGGTGSRQLWLHPAAGGHRGISKNTEVCTAGKSQRGHGHFINSMAAAYYQVIRPVLPPLMQHCRNEVLHSQDEISTIIRVTITPLRCPSELSTTFLPFH